MILTLKERHDQHLAQMPEGAVHDTDGCSICNPDLSVDENSTGGGDMKTYTEEEFNAAVAEAVAPLKAAAEAKVTELQSELDGLKASQAATEAEGRVAELQVELDKAEIRVADATKKYDDLVAFLEGERAAAAEAAEQAARSEARAEVLKASTPLADEKVAEIVDRFIAMDDEAFSAIVEDYKAVSAAAPAGEQASEKEEIPAETAMSNVRDEQATEKGFGSVFSARNHGVDVRSI